MLFVSLSAVLSGQSCLVRWMACLHNSCITLHVKQKLFSMCVVEQHVFGWRHPWTSHRRNAHWFLISQMQTMNATELVCAYYSSTRVSYDNTDAVRISTKRSLAVYGEKNRSFELAHVNTLFLFRKWVVSGSTQESTCFQCGFRGTRHEQHKKRLGGLSQH